MKKEKKIIIHYDLFSGIGGFALAVDNVYGKENTQHIFVENDPFCQAVLKKHWPESEFWCDIREFVADTEQQGLERTKSDKELQSTINIRQSEITILTGGFPCQPFSQAGVRKGADDERYLWPEMFRVIRELRPRWVIAENVVGLLTIQDGLVFEQVCADLESQDYEVQPYVIPACAVGAPHRRDRVWITAHTAGERSRKSTRQERGIQKWEMESNQPKRGEVRSESERCFGDDPNTNPSGLQKPRAEQQASGSRQSHENVGNTKSNSEHPFGKISQRENTLTRGSSRNASYAKSGQSWKQAKQKRRKDFERRSWERNWIETATRLCRVDDGLPRKMVRLPDGREISYARWRKEGLKAFGNAIVPKVAMKILEGIKFLTPQ